MTNVNKQTKNMAYRTTLDLHNAIDNVFFYTRLSV